MAYTPLSAKLVGTARDTCVYVCGCVCVRKWKNRKEFQTIFSIFYLGALIIFEYIVWEVAAHKQGTGVISLED